MQSVPNEARLELKFVGDHTASPNVMAWIDCHPCGFRSIFPPRWINNLYFDTNEFNAFNENVAGVSSRAKLRYRWYGARNDSRIGYIELKCKRNQYGWKVRENIALTDALEGRTWNSIKCDLSARVSNHFRSWLDYYSEKVLINRYHRKYYLSTDGLIRVTVDSHLEAWDQRRSAFTNDNFRANLPPMVIVEIKCGKQEYRAARDVIQGMPIRVSRMSKYVVGLNSLTI